jgi:glyoxylase-like metal-dependent hydrolase (beta-lactamase superfamily II)
VIKEPPEAFNDDTAENRRSIRKLAALKPSLILPGHGAAITDMAKFERFVDALPPEPQRDPSSREDLHGDGPAPRPVVEVDQHDLLPSPER